MLFLLFHSISFFLSSLSHSGCRSYPPHILFYAMLCTRIVHDVHSTRSSPFQQHFNSCRLVDEHQQGGEQQHSSVFKWQSLSVLRACKSLCILFIILYECTLHIGISHHLLWVCVVYVCWLSPLPTAMLRKAKKHTERERKSHWVWEVNKHG